MSRSLTRDPVDGTLYGILVKAINKATVWYNVQAFEDAGVEAPETWDEFLASRDAQRVGHPGLLPRRSGRLDRHRPLRERLHPHRRRGEVRPARGPRDPVDRPVGEGRARRDGQDLRRHRQRPRREGRALQTDNPTSIPRVLSGQPEGRDGHRRRLRADRRRDDPRAGDGVQRLHVPVHQRLAARGHRPGATSSRCSRTAPRRRRSSST